MSNRRIGLEIEVESEYITIGSAWELLSDSEWEVVEDGSLRGGEYAFELRYLEPTPHDRLKATLSRLYPVLQSSSGSWRAAVHCHVDVGDMLWSQRAVALGFASLYDMALFQRHAPERVESNFSVPLAHKSMAVRDCISAMLYQHRQGPSYGKYSSINAQSMHEKGSIEFRHMQTPHFSDLVPDIMDGLNRIARYVDDCVSIVDMGCRLSRCLPPANNSTSGSPRLIPYLSRHIKMLKSPLEVDGDALARFIHILERDKGADPTMLDMATIHRAGATRPRSRDTMRYIFAEEESEEYWDDAAASETLESIFNGDDEEVV